MNIAIFGAQGIALGVGKALQVLNSGVNVLCFVVSKKGLNHDFLNDIPVIELSNLRNILDLKKCKELDFLIATPENLHLEIEEILEMNGFFHHHRITSCEYAAMMELYYAAMGNFPLLRSRIIGNKASFVRCLVALSEFDKPLRGRVKFEDWMDPIQVGAAFGNKIIANLRDDEGNNISHKNRNYSELTALYWLWKNRLCSDGGENIYYGLMQYRRRLMIENEDLYRLESNGIDVVLPYPMIYEPNILVHPKRYLKDIDLQNILTALNELYPIYVDAVHDILSQPYFYNYNIILAKKFVLADFCNWIFPILERVEELNAHIEVDRADRYIGYIGELLETLYFMYHKEDLHIVHTGCKFYV